MTDGKQDEFTNGIETVYKSLTLNTFVSEINCSLLVKKPSFRKMNNVKIQVVFCKSKKLDSVLRSIWLGNPDLLISSMITAFFFVDISSGRYLLFWHLADRSLNILIMNFILSVHDPLVLRRFRSNLILTRQNTVKTLEEVDFLSFFIRFPRRTYRIILTWKQREIE